MTSSYVTKPDLRILDLLVSLCTWKGKTYCFPAQQKILKLLTLRYGLTISRSTLNRHLKALQLGGYIKRQRRHQKHRTLGWMFRSTLYMIGPRTLQRMGRISRQCGNFLKTAMQSEHSLRVSKMAHKLKKFYESVLPQPSEATAGAPNST